MSADRVHPRADPADMPDARLAGAGGVVLAGYLVARFLGYVRLLAYAAIFGAGVQLDAFTVAFRLPDVVPSLVASGAIAAAVAAPMSRALAIDGGRDAGRTASTLLTWTAIALAAFGALVFVAAPVLIPVLAPGFPDASTDLAIALSREMAVAPLLLGLGGVVGGILQADRRYVPALLGPIAYNVVSVASALVLSGPLGAHALSVGVVGGSLAYLAIQLPALLRMRLGLRPATDLADRGLRRAVGLMGPRALGLSVDQAKLVLALAAASTLPVGSVTAFAIAYTIFQIPAGILSIPLGTVALPEMAARHARGAADSLAHLVIRAVRLVLFLVLPVAAIAVGLAPYVADLLFGHGRFTDEDVARSAAVVAVLFVGLPGATVTAFANRALYAIDRTAAVVAAAVVDVGVTSAALLLLTPLGLTGVATAFATGWLVAATIVVGVLARRIPTPAWGRAGAVALRLALVAALAGLLSAALATGLMDGFARAHGRLVELVVVGVAGGAGVLLYGAAAWFGRVREVAVARGIARDLVTRARPRRRP